MQKTMIGTDKLLWLEILALFMIGSAGCSYVSPVRMVGGSRYYLLEPTVFDGAIERAKKADKGRSVNPESLSPCGASGDVKVSDCDVVEFTREVKTMLRERYNNARLARTFGGFVQVVTSAVSGMLTGINGGSAVTAATILSGTSSVIPEVSSVIEAKDRGEAYADGLKSVETAEGVYLKSIADGGGGKISTEKLTPAAATLYDTVLAAIHVVEARLAALLPSTEELKKARSEFEKIEVVPTEVSLKPEGKTPLRIVRGSPVTAASGNPSIAKAEEKDSGTKVDIEALKDDCRSTTVTLANASGGRATTTVRVENDPAFSVSPPSLKFEIKKGAKIEDTKPLTVNVSRGCPIQKVWSDAPGIVEVEIFRDRGKKDLDRMSAKITPLKKEKTIIHLENDTGRLAEVAVEVVEVE